MTTQHVWLHGPRRAARASALNRLVRPDVTVCCHRRLRGPYTGLGSVLRAVGADAHRSTPDLTSRHVIEILCVAPELTDLLGEAPGTLTSLAPPEERTRWYSALRTRRIAHGIVEFLRDHAQARPGGHLVLAFDSVDSADHTDQEFLAIALRRLDPERVRLVVGTGTGDLSDELADALRNHARRVEAPPPDARKAGEADEEARARAFVDSDGTSDDPDQQAAYARVDPAVRAAWHDARADELERTGEYSLRLGAIPYHRLAGADPAGAGWRAVVGAENYCMGMGYYHAVLEVAELMADLVARYEKLAPYRHQVMVQIAQALPLLERAEETEPIYLDLLSRTDQPHPHMSLHYALGMLYTRHFPERRKDHDLARAHLNTAVAIAGLLPDPADRAFHTAFMRNGLALVEMHRGDLARSLELVSSGIDLLNRELPPDRHLLHRTVLLNNRAQVLAALGRAEEAIADFDRVIELDPHYAEYYFERGNSKSKAGDYAGAIADYELAMAYSPPFPELYYNRGDARAALGHTDAAVEDFRYVLDLEPDHVESRVALASLLLDTGDALGAAEQARQGLQFDPDHPRLLCVLGQAAAEQGDVSAARDAFDRALRADGSLYEALVNRAALAYEQGDPETALSDLDRAVNLVGDDPDVLFNRGLIREEVGRYVEAVADYTRALDLPGADTEELLRRRAACQAVLGPDPTPDGTDQPRDQPADQPTDGTAAVGQVAVRSAAD